MAKQTQACTTTAYGIRHRVSSSLVLGFFLAIFAFSGCSDDDVNPSGNAIPANVDISGHEMYIASVKTLAEAGNGPNDIALNSRYAYVVSSGDNTISRIDLATLELQKNYLDLGDDSAPSACWAEEDALYIVQSGNGGKALQYSLGDKTRREFRASFVSPSAIRAHNGTVFVADSEYGSGTGSVYAFAENSSTPQKLATSAHDPMFLDVYHADNGAKTWLIVVDSGWTSGTESIPPKSCVDFWDITDIATVSESPAHSYCVQNASLGHTAVVGNTLYIGDGMKPILHTLDLAKLGTDGLTLGSIALSNETMGMTTPVHANGHLFAFDFNRDTMYWDLESEQPQSLGLTKAKSDKKGPVAAAYDAARKQILVVHSMSGSVDVVGIK